MLLQITWALQQLLLAGLEEEQLLRVEELQMHDLTQRDQMLSEVPRATIYVVALLRIIITEVVQLHRTELLQLAREEAP